MMNFPSLVLAVFSICCIILTSKWRARRSSKLPPGPYPFPIIGNILHLSSQPHRSLTKLSRKYGPVISLKLGRQTAIVVSSPEAAKLVLQKHDMPLSSRTVPIAATSCRHHELSIAWLPVGNQWRKLRRICKEQIFSASRLEASQGFRREMLQKLCGYVKESSETGRAVDIGDATFTTSLNIISVMLFSLEYAMIDSDSLKEMKVAVLGAMRCSGSHNWADYFPVLKYVDPQGILKQARFHYGKLLALLDEIIDERLRSRAQKNDVLQALVDLHQIDEAQFTRNDIQHLLFDLVLGGIDTSSGTAEWAMTELLRNPIKMARLRNELETFAKENGEIQDSDIQRLPYLQAVVKETLRLHPPGPFLVPHKAESCVEINGFIVPKNANILVNVWASGRDPKNWTDPEEFVPERFLNEKVGVDFRGQDFELIPFGAGRRICPGLPLGYMMVHQMVATLLAKFEWKLEAMKPEEIDMTEKFGLSLRKAVSLTAVPTQLQVCVTC